MRYNYWYTLRLIIWKLAYYPNMSEFMKYETIQSAFI